MGCLLFMLLQRLVYLCQNTYPVPQIGYLLCRASYSDIVFLLLFLLLLSMTISYIPKCELLLQVFGEVAEGLETLTRINEAYVDEKSRPYKNIR